MPGLTGHSTTGVGADIVSFLTEVAKIFSIDIHVTSGFRSPDTQAQAMWDNWIKLKRGAVYKVAALPLTDRATLDGHYATGAEDKTATAAAKALAKTSFVKLAKERLGAKSKHASGRALDVRVASVNAKVYKAITLKLKEIKEGRNDIYHFESDAKIPAIDAQLKAQIQAIKDGPMPVTPAPKRVGHVGLSHKVHTCR